MRSPTFSTLVLLAALALPAGSCDNVNLNMIIMFAVAPDEECVYKIQAEDDTSLIPGGLIDLGHPIYSLSDSAVGYYGSFQVHNYTLSNADSDTGRLNSRDVMLNGVELSYTWLRNESLVAFDPLLAGLESEEVSIPKAAVLPAAEDPGSPGQLLMGLNLFPRYLGSRLLALQDFANDPDNLDQLVLGVAIRLVGTTLGGTRVESNTMVFPIRFCHGCLSTAVCPDGTTLVPSCVPGQDYVDPELCPSDTGT